MTFELASETKVYWRNLDVIKLPHYQSFSKKLETLVVVP